MRLQARPTRNTSAIRPCTSEMAEHSPRRHTPKTRPADESVAVMGTQTEEEQNPERQGTSLARERNSGSDGQLSRRPPAEEANIVRGHGEEMEPTHRHHDRGGAPAVRLDMDLDVDIKLQAKIKGDLELSIL
ncbi:hypothetical protein N658DRAFT_208120 [Parathielavia hyrcaniae]|uniref:Uncharacterized protein n=1 Tax=Parathielavia hyrcaniae TaxID=113614 RepID=A0AAN6SZV7_9PEZI|nr:hypothetical protein N658DRAFT_208120 [Parathielavia hyrcaniae]